MSNDTMKISVPSYEKRDNVTTLEGWRKVFTDSELVEIVHRYCNTQDASKKYRHQAAARVKELKAFAEAHPELFK